MRSRRSSSIACSTPAARPARRRSSAWASAARPTCACALAKRAATRALGTRCADPEGAKLEAAAGGAVNQLGVGPQGLGGDSTAFAVHVETRGDAHHDESGRGEHAVPLRRGARAPRSRRPGVDLRILIMAHYEFDHADHRRRRCARCASTTPSRCNGTLFGIRDATQIHMFDRGRTTRFDLARPRGDPHGAERAQGRAEREQTRPATRRFASARRPPTAWSASPSR